MRDIQTTYQDKPGFLIFLVFTLGVVIAFEGKLPSHSVFLCIPLISIIILFLATIKRIHISSLKIIVLLFFTILSLGVNKAISHLPDYSKINALSEASPTISAEFTVKETLKSSGNWCKFIAKPIGSDPFNSDWLIYCPVNMDSMSISPGTKVRITAHPAIQRPDLNPSLFDYTKYLNRRGVYITCFLKNQEDLVFLPHNSRSIPQIFDFFRRKIESLIDKTFPEPRHAAFQKAILVGVSDELDDELMLEFRKSGAIHVLAISGLHVGIVAGILLFIINLIVDKSHKWWRLILLFSGIWLFVLIAGMRPSVFRAGLMFSVYFFGIIINRKIKAYQALGLAGLVILIVDPKNIYNLGFQLSFAAVFGIVTFYPFLKSIFPSHNKIIRFVWDGLAVALAAQVTTLPILLYNFKEISMVFWLSGIVVVPLMGLLLPLALINLFLTVISPDLAFWSAKAVAMIMDLMIHLNHWISNRDFAYIQSLPFDGIMLILSILVIVSVALYLSAANFWYISLAATGIVLIFAYNFYSLVAGQHQRRIIQYADTKNIAFQVVNGTKSCNFISAEPSFNLANAFKYNSIKYRLSDESDTVILNNYPQIFPIKIDDFLWLSDSSELHKLNIELVWKAVFLHGEIVKAPPNNFDLVQSEEIILPQGLSESIRYHWIEYGLNNNIKIIFQDDIGQVTYNY